MQLVSSPSPRQLFLGGLKDLIGRNGFHTVMPRLSTRRPVAGYTGTGADDLDFIFAARLRPLGVIRPKQRDNLSFQCNSDMPRAGIIGDNQVRSAQQGLQLAKIQLHLSQVDQRFFGMLANPVGNLYFLPIWSH